MIRTIEIRNFRCFEHHYIEGCRQINVIVGNNGTGKTSLLEAIFLALGAAPEIGVRYRRQRGLDGTFAAPPQKIEEALWKDLFFEGNWHRPIKIELTGDGPEARSVTVYRGKSQLTIPLELGTKEEESRTAPIAFRWRDSEGKEHERTPKLSAAGLDITESDEDLPDFFYFAAAHPIGSGENAARFSELRRAGRGPSFVKLLTQAYDWIQNLDIEVVAGSPIIYAKLRNSKDMLPLAYVSGGVDRMISIMLAIASRDHSVVLVDQLEDGIFHTHHEALWRALLTVVRGYEGQLFATTHSLEWLKALMKAAQDKVDDIALWRLERGNDGRPVLFQFEGDTLKDAFEYGTEARGA